MRVRLSNVHFFLVWGNKLFRSQFWIIWSCCSLLEANFDFNETCTSTAYFEIACLMSKHVVQILIRFKCFLLFEINNCVLYCKWTKKLADSVLQERERAIISFPDSFFLSLLYKWKLCQSKKWKREDIALRAVLWCFTTSRFYLENSCLQNVKQLQLG